ncbi:Fur family transcriptional regulator [Pelotomaculum propionicicum]|uniref:Ferric uptake regulation protein n=1 Tax=Pelotomaculum propionicicum TaxID=258475 RepID=A0A4Y7RIJ6_9FIRM|nr:Fur family transcriptional regulator [Pelotomaculum propionicicum]NLI14392.1 transcriptional repressor [Peptococcaceae bacterium]TEB08828.1 Ferric uptake regulation protein [Pelotomaculum propionicicum]
MDENIRKRLHEMRKNGYKITPQRQEIVNAFLDSSRKLPLSAEEVYMKVKEKYQNISLDTVYRNLAVLQNLKIINRVNFHDVKSRYELNPGGDHQHHMICLTCGSAEPINFCPLKLLSENNFAAEKNFEIREHTFELFGYCSTCRERAIIDNA